MVRPGNKRLLKARMTNDGAGVNKSGIHFGIGKPIALQHVYNKKCTINCDETQGQNRIRSVINRDDKSRSIIKDFNLFKLKSQNIDSKQNNSRNELPSSKQKEPEITIPAVSIAADVETRTRTIQEIFYDLDKAFDIDGENIGESDINITSASDVDTKLNELKIKQGVKVSGAEFDVFEPLISKTVNKLKFFDLNGDEGNEWTADNINSDAGVFLNAINNPKEKTFDQTSPGPMELAEAGDFILVKTETPGEFKVSKYSKVYENVKRELEAFKDEIISKKLTITIDDDNNKIEISMALKGDKYELRLKNNSSTNKIKLYHFSFKKNAADKTWDLFAVNQALPTNNTAEDFSLTIFGGKELDVGGDILLGSIPKSDITTVKGFPFEIRDDSADILFNYSDDDGTTWKKGLVPDNNTDMNSRPINASIANYKERTIQENRIISGYIDKIMERFYFGNFYNEIGTTPVITIDDFNKAMLYSSDDVVKLQNRLDQRHGNYLKYLLYKITKDKLVKQDTIESERTTPKLKEGQVITITDDKLNIEFESTNVKKVYVFLTDNTVFGSVTTDDSGLSTLIAAVNGKSPGASPGANVLFKSEQQSAKTFKIPIHPNILKAETFSTTANSTGYSIKKSTNLDTIDGFYVGQSDEDKKSKSINLRLIIVAFGTSEAMMHIEKYQTPIPFENKEYTNGISDFDTNHDKVNKLKLTVAGDLTQENISAFTVGLDKLKAVQTKLKELKHYNTDVNPKNTDHSSKITTLDGELTRYNKLLTDWNKAVKLLSEMTTDRVKLDINKTLIENKKIIDTLQNIATHIGAVWQQNLKKLGALINGWMDATDNILLQKNKWVKVVEALKEKEKDNATKDRANLSTKYATYFATPSQKPPPLPDSDTVQSMHKYIMDLTPASGAPTTGTIINKLTDFNTEKTIHETIIGGNVFEPQTLEDKFSDHYYVAALNEIKTNYNGGYPSQAISLTGLDDERNFMTWLKKSKLDPNAYDNIFSKLVPHFDKRRQVVEDDGIVAGFNNTHRVAFSPYPTTINTILEANFDPQPAKLVALTQLKKNLVNQSSNLIVSERAYSVALDIHINNEQDRIVLDNAKKYLGGDSGIQYANIGAVMEGSDVDTINTLIASDKFINYPGIQAKKKETADEKTKYIDLLTKLDSWYINGGNTFVKKGNEGVQDVEYTAPTFKDIHKSTVQGLENTIEDVNEYNKILKTLKSSWNSTQAVLNGINLMYSNLSETRTNTGALVYNDTELEKSKLDDLIIKINTWKTIVDNFTKAADAAKQNKDNEADAVAKEKTGWIDHITMPLDLSPDTNKNFIDNNIDDSGEFSLVELSTTGSTWSKIEAGTVDTFAALKTVYDTDMPNPWNNEPEDVLNRSWCKFSLKQEEENVSPKNLIFSVDISASSVGLPGVVRYGVDEMIITFKNPINALLTTADGIYLDFEKSSNTIIILKDTEIKQSNWLKNQSLFYGKKNIAKIKNGKGKEFLQAIQKIEVFCGGAISGLRYKRLYTPTQRIGRISITTKTQEQKQERIRGGFELPEFLTRSVGASEPDFDNIVGNYISTDGPNNINDADALWAAVTEYNRINWDDWIIDIQLSLSGGEKLEDVYLNEKRVRRIKAKNLYLIPQLDTTAAKILKTHTDDRTATVFQWKKNKDSSLFKMVHPLCKYGKKLEELKKSFVSKAGVQAVMKTVQKFQVAVSRGVDIGIEEYTVDEKKMGRITIKQVDPKNPVKFFGAKLTLNKSIGADDSAFIWKEATSKDEDIVIKDVNVDNTSGSEKTVIAFVKYTSPNGYDFDGILGEFEWTSDLDDLDFSSSNDENTITISNTAKSGTFKNLRPTAAVATTKQQESSRVDLVVVDSDKVAVILKNDQDIASFELNIYDDNENGTQLSESTITGDKTSDLEEIKRILDNNDLVHPEFIPSTSVLKENPDDISNESFRMLATCLSDESSFSKSIFCGILKVDTPNSEKTPDVDNVKIDFTII